MHKGPHTMVKFRGAVPDKLHVSAQSQRQGDTYCVLFQPSSKESSMRKQIMQIQGVLYN